MDFYKRVGIVCRAIPCGKVASYGQIALLCGCPRHARQVGYALKCGCAGEVPAYRVDLKKDGWHHTLADALDFRKQFEDAGI